MRACGGMCVYARAIVCCVADKRVIQSRQRVSSVKKGKAGGKEVVVIVVDDESLVVVVGSSFGDSRDFFFDFIGWLRTCMCGVMWCVRV